MLFLPNHNCSWEYINSDNLACTALSSSRMTSSSGDQKSISGVKEFARDMTDRVVKLH